MQKVVSSIKALLDTTILDANSPIHDIKRVFFGDPIIIPESDLPALAIQPISTDYTMRWSRYDEKRHTVEIRLVYNQKQYFWRNLATWTVITAASFATGEINFTSTDHWLLAGESVVISGVVPAAYNGTYLVDSVVDDDNFKVVKVIDPTAYLAGWTAQKANNDKVFAIEDAINKVESMNVDHSTAALSVCGTIQRNSTLPYADGAVTRNAAELAKIVSVSYAFSENRWFPTFEVVTTVQATVIGDR